MIVEIVAVGRLRAGPEAELLKRYLDRAKKAGSAIGVSDILVKEIPESRAGNVRTRKRQEADQIARLSAACDASYCLDETGESMTSKEFALMIRRSADHGRKRIALIIGGPDGLDTRILEECERSLAFGRVTWPHQIVRILLAEQLFRAITILTNHPYHKA